MTRRLLAVILTAVLILGLAACGQREKTPEASKTRTSSDCEDREDREDRDEDDKEDGTNGGWWGSRGEEDPETEEPAKESTRGGAAAESTGREPAAPETEKEETKEPETTGEETRRPIPEDLTTVKLEVAEAYMDSYGALWTNLIEPLKYEGIDLQVVSSDSTGSEPWYETDIDLLPSTQLSFFLSDTNVKTGGILCPIAYLYTWPMNIYSSEYTSLDEIQPGDTVAITVESVDRCLEILEAAGLIRLSPDRPEHPEVLYGEQEEYIEKVVEEYLVDITIDACIMETGAMYGIGLPVDAKACVVQSQMADMERAQFGRDLNCLFEAPLTYEDDMTVLLARIEDMKGPVKREAYEKVVKAYQSDLTVQKMAELNMTATCPAGWDIDLFAPYR